MTIKSALAQHLTTKATTAAGRVYRAGEVPTSATFPLIEFSVASADHIHHHGGSTLIVEKRFQIDCWDRDDDGSSGDAAVTVLAEEVRSALDTFRGSLGSGGDAVNCRDIKLTTEFDDYEAPTDGSQRGRWRRSMDYTVWHDEVAPDPAV